MPSVPTRVRRLPALVAALVFGCAAAPAQTTVPAVLLSDIHFDPFHEPRLLPQLRAAPIERWPAILDAGSTLREDADLAALQIDCHAAAMDTAWPLLKGALTAAHQAQPLPIFVTLSGDLLTHQFPCRFRHLAPGASDEDLAAFSAKTVNFVAMELRLAFPNEPVYLALGNNDSGCGDYDETAGSPFMQSASAAMARSLGRGSRRGARAPAALSTSPEGDYSVALPKPLLRGRLIVLQDIFDATAYKTCAGTTDRSSETSQIAWLRAQLTDARARSEQVWVMGHIPPGVDVFSSFAKYVLRPGELCSAPVKQFLADSALADTLLDFADVIRLALFAHTHMDEIRLLHRAASEETGQAAAVVAAKLVPSITPYFGNHPAFLVAAIDPRTLVLDDWEAFVSPDRDGSAASWKMDYDFRTAYGLPNLSAASASEVADGFTADRGGNAPHSKFYRDHFYAGGLTLYSLGLEQIWPAYACSVRENRVEAFHECLCPAQPPSRPIQ